MSNRIITISREFGSGGRTIGKEVAAKLGIACYDSGLIEKIAEESGLSKEYIQGKDENAPKGTNGWGSIFSIGSIRSGFAMPNYLWSVQKQVIEELAQKESCVIVGRCADYILREQEDCLKVFIHADIEKRAERIARVYGEREDSPEKRVRDKDKLRKSYHRFYTDMEWGEAANYHICLDSGVLGIEKCVEIISDLY